MKNRTYALEHNTAFRELYIVPFYTVRPKYYSLNKMSHSDLTDAKIQFRGLFIDFLKKALVVTDHNILVYKLEHYDDTRTLKAVILHQNKSKKSALCW